MYPIGGPWSHLSREEKGGRENSSWADLADGRTRPWLGPLQHEGRQATARMGWPAGLAKSWPKKEREGKGASGWA
ncbi:hypothetical protein E2562_014133 [Oryza meyeriana var. granulata]|uniref:Uncharacterized protein n=1 Tax=Oryza meyeriana var. granulata TaxID=110450 RepID=A0A6G1F8G3_9ORYZ|nr:hypothetical protein E2562_014133 [Oryza meyeriana var. granulata]